MELETSQFVHALREKVRVLMNDYSDSMISGQCNDFPEYRRVCGVVHGLALAERELLDLAKQLEDAQNA